MNRKRIERHFCVLTMIIAVCASVGWGQQPQLPPAPKVKLPFYVYSDLGTEKPGYDFAPSGWMGNNLDALEVDSCHTENTRHGPCCMKIVFSDANSWAGIVWQNPAGNWGDEDGGLDLTGAKKLTFWARGERGNEMVEFKMGVIGPNKKFHDSGRAGLGRVRLDKNWKQFTIPLDGVNLSRIVSGFCFSVKGRSDAIIFYLDDIIYE